MRAHPSPADIRQVCRFFSLGKLQSHEEEKGIDFPHAHYSIFITTTHGSFILKFFPSNASPKIMAEYSINRILISHQWATPRMYAGINNKPFCPVNNSLAACYSYIEGRSAWKYKEQRAIFRRINTALLSLKNILSSELKPISFLKEAPLTVTINRFLRASRSLTLTDHRATINQTLLDAYQIYQQHQSLFARQWLHNDANLSNFLIYQKTVYILDLEHVREDYILSDLSSLIVSCILSVPLITIKKMAQDYFTQDKLSPEHALVLTTLIKIGLIKEYLGHLQDKKRRPILTLLRKINANPRLII